MLPRRILILWCSVSLSSFSSGVPKEVSALRQFDLQVRVEGGGDLCHGMLTTPGRVYQREKSKEMYGYAESGIPQAWPN